MLHLGTNRPAGPPTESHQPLLTASAPQKFIEEPKGSTHNENTNAGKDRNSTRTRIYSKLEYLFHVNLQYKNDIIMSCGKDKENVKQKVAQNLYNTLINESRETNQNVQQNSISKN